MVPAVCRSGTAHHHFDDVRHLERIMENLRSQPMVIRTGTMVILSVLVDRPTGLGSG